MFASYAKLKCTRNGEGLELRLYISLLSFVELYYILYVYHCTCMYPQLHVLMRDEKEGKK